MLLYSFALSRISEHDKGSINLGGMDCTRNPENNIQKQYSSGKSDVYMFHESCDVPGLIAQVDL